MKTQIILLSIMMGFSLNAGAEELKELAKQNAANVNASVASEGDVVWVNNLCKRITERGVSNEVIRPLSEAIKTCPDRRDYGEIVSHMLSLTQ